MNGESASKDITLLDDTGVYFVPAEADLFQTQITPRPFLISNPVKANPKISRIKKGSEAKKDSSEETSEHIETYERRKTFIRVSNNDESQIPSYLDLEIQDVASSETSVIQKGNFIPNFESTERALVECLDLHILDLTRKYGSVENLNEFWEARNLQIYEDMSNSDLNDKIKKYCSETEFVIEQSLQDIKRGVPKRKANFKYVHEYIDDINKKHEKKQPAPSFDFKSFSSLTESTSVYESRTELPSLNHNSIEHLSERHDLNNFDSNNESILESLTSPNLSRNTDPTTDNTNESKSIDTNSNKAENTMPDVIIVTTENTAKSYDTEFDMATIPSEFNFKTIYKINKSDFDLATNKPILDKTTIFPISTTPLSHVLLFRDTSGITEKSLTEKQDESQGIFFKLDTMPSEIILKINNETNKSNNKIIENEPIFDKPTIFSASTTPLSEELSLRDISGSSERSNAAKETRANETLQFNLDTKPSEVILKENNKTNKSLIIMASNELILDDIHPASTASKNYKPSLGNLSSNSETLISEKQDQEKDESQELDLDQVTTPLEVSLNSINSNSEFTMSNINITSNESNLDNITLFSASTTPQKEKLTLGGTSSNSETIDEKQGERKQEGKELDLYMPSEVVSKLNNETNETNINKASDERNLDTTTLFSASTTQITAELSLGVTSNNSEISMAEKEAEDKGEGVKLDFVTMPSKVILKPSSEIKPYLNVAGKEDITFFPTASTLPQNDKVSLDIASSNSEQSMTELQEKHTNGDVNHDLNTGASKTTLNTPKVFNTPGLNIVTSLPILENNFKFITTSKSPQNEKSFINKREETISYISSKEDTSVLYITTIPVNSVRSQRPNKLRESEVQIPKIITKECQNNEVQSFINGNEAIPNNDFKHSDEKSKSLQKKIKQGSDEYSELNPISSAEGIDATSVFNNSYISGNLYFGSSQELVPVRLLQTDSGKVSLGIDGQSLCEKILQKQNSKSLLLSTLCDCVQFKMRSNNSTDIS